MLIQELIANQWLYSLLSRIAPVQRMDPRASKQDRLPTLLSRVVEQ